MTGIMDMDLPKNVFSSISETEYFMNESDILKKYYCPNCRSKDCLFKGFFSIGCNNCGFFNGLDEVTEFNIMVHNGLDPKSIVTHHCRVCDDKIFILESINTGKCVNCQLKYANSPLSS